MLQKVALDKVDTTLPQDGQAIGVFHKGGDGLASFATNFFGDAFYLFLILDILCQALYQIHVDFDKVDVQVFEGLIGILLKAKTFQSSAVPLSLRQSAWRA